MIRKAVSGDLDAVERSYTELLLHEREHGAYTVWQLGVYPTRATAEKALEEGSLYLLEREDQLCASIILNQEQPPEYGGVDWRHSAGPEEVLVVHLLCVRPSMAGQGAGKALVGFALEEGRRRGCRVVRLDTGAQNKPAASLYRAVGFELAGTASMAIGGVISHAGHLFFEKALSESGHTPGGQGEKDNLFWRDIPCNTD